MHILTRKSSLLSTSQALEWHTTSRSAGLLNSERSQNVAGSGANPREMKNPSPYGAIPLASLFRSCKVFVRSNLCAGFGESIKPYTLFHSWLQIFPSKWAGIGPCGGTTLAPYFFASCPRTYACSERYNGRSCSHKRSISAVNSSGGMSYCERQIDPASWKPSSAAPLSPSSTIRAYFVRMGAPTACQPIQARFSSSGSRLVAINLLTAVTSRHLGFSPLALEVLPSGHHFPFP